MKQGKYLWLLAAAGGMVFCLQTIGPAGDLNPPVAPGSTMKTLDEVEPRIPIHQSDIPLTISTSGSYYLAENVTAVVNGIIIGADHVTIDLGGFTIAGIDTSATFGIYAFTNDNIEVRNGTIRGFRYGIYEESGTGDHYRIFDIRAVSNLQAGIFLTGQNHQIRNCTIAETGNSEVGSIYGIYAGPGSTITGNSIYNNGTMAAPTSDVYGIRAGAGGLVTNNIVYSNGTLSAGVVFGIMSIESCTISGNTVYYNGTEATGNYVFGIHAGNGAIISGNVINDNGIFATCDYVYGLYAGTGGSVADNTSYSNGSYADSEVYGIYTNTGCTVTGNTSHNNGTYAYGAVYGIYLSDYNLVTNNAAYGNDGTNMNMPANCVFGINLAP